MKPRIRIIQHAVAQFYDMDVALMSARCRTAEVARARQIAMFIVKRFTRYDLLTIADAFARDRGTVIHAVNTVLSQMQVDPKYRADYMEVERMALDELMRLDPPRPREAVA